MIPHPRRRPTPTRPRSRAQALVELALVMPVMVGIVAVLFQFGILFMSYLSVVHSTRDVGRWLSVHPDTTDSVAQQHARDNAPSVISPANLTVTMSPVCTALVSGGCPGRDAGELLTLTVAYNASSSVFLPTQFRLGPYIDVAIPTGLSSYVYYVMVERH
jgi:hypothetical protein